jgi:putative hemolysin
MSKEIISIGILEPPLTEQLRGKLSEGRAQTLEKYRKAVLMLWAGNIISEGEYKKAVDRLGKKITSFIKREAK